MLKGLKRGIKGVMVVGLIISFFSPAIASDTKFSVDITKVGMGARPMSLGGAYAGLADDASAVFTNPGGLGMQKKYSFVSMSTQILNTVDYQLAGVAYPTEYGVFGFGYIGVTAPAGDHIYYDETGTTIEGGSMNYTNSMYVLSYGNQIGDMIADRFGMEGAAPKVSVGASIKMISQGLSGYSKAPSATGIQTDIGAVYTVDEKLALGATIQNLTGSIDWSTGEKERLPMTLKLGSSYKALENVTLLLDTDMNMSQARSLVLHGGVEYQVIQYLSLRAGFDQSEGATDVDTSIVNTNYSLGVGIDYANVRFDYTYKINNEFSDLSTHYFSICFFGDNSPKTTKVENDNNSMAKLDVPAEEQQDNEGSKTNMERKLGISSKSSDSSESVLSQYEKLIESSRSKTVAQNNE
jgi:hypothetical protein